MHVKALSGNIFNTSSEGFIHLLARNNINLQSVTQSIALASNQYIDLGARSDIIISSSNYIRLDCGFAGDGQGAGTIDIYSGQVRIQQMNETYPSAYTLRNNKADPAQLADKAQQVSLEAITDHMVRPDHESWNRDEDAGKCKTPRNKKYQG